MNPVPLRSLLLGFFLTLLVPIQAQVVINEILYHAPDELDDLQFIELHNAGPQAVDLAGWSFTKGIDYRFPAGSRIESGGFLVLCQNADRFKEFYKVPVAGVFKSGLSHHGERLELSDAGGRRVDAVRFRDRSPWPMGADGYSGSLERICPTAAGDDPANWISSPLSESRDKPSGTPGRVNAGYSPVLPPVITGVRFSPELAAVGQPIVVEADVRSGDPVSNVELLYRLAGPGYEKPDQALPMKPVMPGRYTGTIPGQPAGQLIRFRVAVTGTGNARRLHPAPTEPRPAFSAYVPGPVEPSKIPVGWIIRTTEKEKSAAEKSGNGFAPGGFMPPEGPRPPSPEETARVQARDQAQGILEQALDLSPLWFELTLGLGGGDPKLVDSLRPWMLSKLEERARFVQLSLSPDGLADRVRTLADSAAAFVSGVTAQAGSRLGEADRRALGEWTEQRRRKSFPGESMILGRLDLEGLWYALTLNAEPEPGRLPQVGAILREHLTKRDVLLAEVKAGTGKERLFRDQRIRADELKSGLEGALKPHLSQAQAGEYERWSQQPREVVVGIAPPRPGPGGPGGGPFFIFGGPGGPFGQPASEPGSHQSAFVYFDPVSRRMELFDFVQVTGRKAGQKVHFYKDHPLGQLTTIALIFEGEVASLVEPLAYEVYRRAGMPVEQSYHVRLWQDGKPAGYSILIEQPNRAFLRRNQIDDTGNMYKLLWFGGDLVGQHEKHTNRRSGHDDLKALVDGLEKSRGQAQWDFIQKNFDVEEVATYFAVNMVLSHWDGFFNNYFTYHDGNGTGKWSMYPWDQDSTWGQRDGEQGPVFTNMALTFGMTGDSPPEDGGPWRGPGFFSGPLLANPGFRKVFLARTRQILETVYTEAVFGPILDRLADQLAPEVKLKAELEKQDPNEALQRFRLNLERSREHLRKRREFLLAQDELKHVVASDGRTAPHR